MTRIELIGLAGVPEVGPGADLARLLVDACARAEIQLRDGDVVCVAQKVVSKAEGALARLPAGAGSDGARRQLAREQATRVVAETADVLIVETRHGFVCANAGVDTSNVPGGMATLLPAAPDASARALMLAIRARTGASVGVVITDTFGRPWRMGQTDVAIGVAGIAPLRDERGTGDRDGRALEVTVVAVADELAAAADLARRKADGTPFVVLRGVPVALDTEASAGELIRPAGEDLFRWGTAEAVSQAIRAAREEPLLGADTVPEWILDEACRAAAHPQIALHRVTTELRARLVEVLPELPPAPTWPGLHPGRCACLWEAPTLLVACLTGPRSNELLLAAGASVQALRVLLAARGYASRWFTIPEPLADRVGTALQLGDGRPLGLLAAGARLPRS